MRGLIPACAGKTENSISLPTDPKAHPRVCGENVIRDLLTSLGEGSSPRVRGKLYTAQRGHSLGGLIPACAGKTEAWSKLSEDSRAHPRVCGENLPRPKTMFLIWGSSPRVRGKPHGQNHDAL